MFSKIALTAIWTILIFSTQLTTANQVSFAESSSQDIDISYTGNRLTLSAKESNREELVTSYKAFK